MSVDTENHAPYQAQVERSDPTAVPAAADLAENVFANVLATEILEKFASANMAEQKENIARHKDFIKGF